MRELGDRLVEGQVLGNLGVVYEEIGNVQQAVRYYEQNLTIARTIGHLDGVGNATLNLASLYVKQGDAKRSLPLARESAQILKQIGSPNASQAQQLVAQLENNGLPNSTTFDLVATAIDIFQRTKSLQDIQIAVSKYPFMMDVKFEQIVERIIKRTNPT